MYQMCQNLVIDNAITKAKTLAELCNLLESEVQFFSKFLQAVAFILV